jgi:NADH:ubiquinone oxidoreductase 24 kD subunit
MATVIEISLCMGSSCFARGNNRLLEMLETAIEKNNWQERVSLAGGRCQNRCGEGPNIIVNGTLYHGMDEGALLDLLTKKMGDPSATVRIRLNEK